MIGLLLLAAVQAVTPAPAADDDIVVIGQRLARLQVMVGKDPRGRFTCALSEASGNATLDARLCKTAAACVRKGARDAAVAPCIDARKPALLAELRRSYGGAAR